MTSEELKQGWEKAVKKAQALENEYCPSGYIEDLYNLEDWQYKEIESAWNAAQEWKLAYIMSISEESKEESQEEMLERCRHTISRILFANQATEENPMPCDMYLGEMYPDGEILDSPHLTSVFESADGIIFFNIEEYAEPLEFDAMCVEDIGRIAGVLEQSTK